MAVKIRLTFVWFYKSICCHLIKFNLVKLVDRNWLEIERILKNLEES